MAMTTLPDDEIALRRDATRILRALVQPGTLLAVLPDVTTAVVLCESETGDPRRVASVDRSVAEIMALKGWITCKPIGKISRYYITAPGRAALNRFTAEMESERAGFAEAPAHFDGAPHKDRLTTTGNSQRRRTAGAESPLRVLGRRRNKAGKAYLSAELIAVGERFQLDFELTQTEPNVARNWKSLMSGPGVAGAGRGDQHGGGPGRQIDARDRLIRAIRRLGPELGDVVLMTCCHQQGMEASEGKMDMPARSGKYVLRIALNMLKRHYDEEGDGRQDLIF